MKGLSKKSVMPMVSARRSQRKKKKNRNQSIQEYTIMNPYRSPNSSKDLPELLGRQLSKFDKLSLQSLQKINFLICEQPLTRERIPTNHQLELQSKKYLNGNRQTLKKMQNAASKQQNQYLQLLQFLQIHTIHQIPELIPSEANKEGHQANEEDQQSHNDEDNEDECGRYERKAHEQESEEMQNIFHDNFEHNSNRFLLYSDHHINGGLEQGFIKDDLDHYLI